MTTPKPSPSGSAAYRLRFTRWQDRVLAFLWPRKRKQLRIAQALIDASAANVQAEVDRLLLDAHLYGTAFIDGATGRRIDPKDVS